MVSAAIPYGRNLGFLDRMFSSMDLTEKTHDTMKFPPYSYGDHGC
jgi:hypothetical protein